MAEINTAGYDTIKKLVNSSETAPSQWDYIEIQNSGTEVLRVSITTDSRASWTSSATDQTQVVSFTVSGGDSDISPPQTVDTSVIKNADSSTAPEISTESFSSVDIQSGDTLELTHEIEVPQV